MNSSHRSSAGFTLLEIIIYFAVFALVLGGIINIEIY
ncbi:MAG: prepilin-type N-terminal cleavage/methylation domain-containing protein, partial [Candidatus Kerfeldbacteria bacterium]|nr:prepilin-type N-terminal cleavage/methylation domain-containing protein [Candidatus Kerfeldbacteria bacterium]